MSTVGERLADLRDRSGLSLAQVAERADYRGRSSVQKFFAAEYDPPFLDMIVAGRLARALVGHGEPEITEDEIFSLTQPKTNKLERYKYAEVDNLKRDVAIHFCDLVSKGPILKGQPPLDTYTIELDNPIGYAWHPPALKESGGIYAIRIQRSPLIPRYRPGEVVFLSSVDPARLGDDVCIYYDQFEREGVSGAPVSSAALVLFGTLERHTVEALHLRTMDGELSFRIRHDQVASMHRLITLADALVE